MSKFLLKSTAFIMIMVFFYGVTFLAVRPHKSGENDYLAAIIDKHARVHQLNCPKLVFAGGSNLAFGINSEKIEKELSIPVVNLGLHAALGLEFILKELRDVITDNDIVCLSIEYFLEPEGQYEIKKNLSRQYKEASEFYGIEIKNEILLNLNSTRRNLKDFLFGHGARNGDDAIYTRNGFNRYGDAIGHLNRKAPGRLNDGDIFQYRYWEGIRLLNQLKHYCDSKGVKVYLFYPQYPQSEYDRNRQVLERHHRDMIQDLEIMIMNSPEESTLKDDLFYDTVYHLNREGREIRTLKIIEMLRRNAPLQVKGSRRDPRRFPAGIHDISHRLARGRERSPNRSDSRRIF